MSNILCKLRGIKCPIKFVLGLYNLLFIFVSISDMPAICQQPVDHSKDVPFARDPGNLPKALDDLKSGVYKARDVELVVRMDAAQAIPPLRDLFQKTVDPDSKQKIAYGLVRLKVEDDTYWNYVSKRALDALNRGAPEPLSYGADGGIIQDRPSDAFAEWAKRHNLDAKEAFRQVVFSDAGSLVDLAASKDRRAIPLLRQALTLSDSTLQSCLMQSAAARGLADLHDQEAVPLIIGAATKASKDCSVAIAEPLVYFDDPAAQNALDRYVPPDMAKALREKRAQGYGPFD